MCEVGSSYRERKCGEESGGEESECGEEKVEGVK